MWKILVCLMVLGFVWNGVQGASGDVLLSGTVQLTDDTNCLQADGNSVGTTNCVEVVVIETENAGEYKIQTLDGIRATSELILNPSGANSFGSSGSTIVFFKTDGNLMTKSALIDSAATFEIRLSTVADVCLIADGTYTSGCTGGTDEWYFEEVSCKGTACATCNADALLCDTCAANEVKNAAKTACEACSVGIHAQCTACNENSGTKTCTACIAGYITDAAAGCAACEATKTSDSDGTSCVDCAVDNCDNCDSGQAECDTCASGYIMNGVTTCEECTVDNCDNCDSGKAECDTCAEGYIKSGATTCEECGAGQTPKSDQTTCVDECTVDNCKYCDAAPATCGTCDDGYHKDGNTCEDCATPIVGCTTCTDVTGTSICSECEDTKTLHSAGTSCVADCTVANCKYCDTAPATCDTCDDGYDMDGNTCEEMATTTTSNGSALTTTMVLLMAVVALKSLILI